MSCGSTESKLISCVVAWSNAAVSVACKSERWNEVNLKMVICVQVMLPYDLHPIV